MRQRRGLWRRLPQGMCRLAAKLHLRRRGADCSHEAKDREAGSARGILRGAKEVPSDARGPSELKSGTNACCSVAWRIRPKRRMASTS